MELSAIPAIPAAIKPLLPKAGQPGLALACQKFEAYFTASLFSAMAKTMDLNQKEGWMKEQKAWVWNGLFQNAAEMLAQGRSLGLARMLENELTSLEKNCNSGTGDKTTF